MSKIDLSNVEAYLLDYADGKLSSEDLAELVFFISLNPQIDFDLSEITELPILKAENISAKFKSQLRKSESDIRERFEVLCIAFYDKEISSIEKNELDHLINQFPSLEKEFLAFSKAYLQEDLSLILQGKESLKKQFNIQGSFDDLCVKEIERGLTEAENSQLVDIIFENDALKKERRAFQFTILKKEEYIYPSKASLYKKGAKPKTILLWSARVAVAASILLVMGIFLFNRTTTNNKGLAFVPADTISGIREAEEIKKQNDKVAVLQNQKTNRNGSSKNLVPNKKQLKNRIENNPINSVATLNHKTALPIKKFELPSDYLALNPAELIQFNETPVAELPNSVDYLNPRQMIWQQITRVLKKNKIDIETPLAEVKKDGFAEISYRSLERASRGSLVIERENHQSKSKITGIQFLGIGFSRSTQ
jgi:hypothetical protein